MKPIDVIINEIPSDEIAEYECVASAFTDGRWFDYKVVFTNKTMWIKRPKMFLIDLGTAAEKIEYEQISRIESIKLLRRKGFKFFDKSGKPIAKFYFDSYTDEAEKVLLSHIS